MRNYNYTDLKINYTGDDLNINHQLLISLESCPDYITGGFYCGMNNLSNLIGGPQRVDGNYLCHNNRLTSLVGCASQISGSLNSPNNQITSLVGIHKIIKSCNSFAFDAHKIIHGGIGVLLIENLSYITADHSVPFHIISTYLGSGTKGMMACRKELIDNGYSDYAKL